MFSKIMNTGSSPVGFILRIALGVVLLGHGMQQTFGFFGGIGMNRKLAYYSGSFHIPAFIGTIGIITISLGSILLIIGFWSRIIAALDAIFLFVAFYNVHIHNGFFMNWEGQKVGEGFEYHILGIGIALAIIIYGSGWMSMDRWLMKWKENKATR